MPLRLSSVTSVLKVTPPKLISCISSSVFSLCMAQLGRAFASFLSWLSVSVMPFMLSVVRFVSDARGERSATGLLSRYSVRRFVSDESGDTSVIILSLRFSVVRPPSSASLDMSLILFPASERLSSA